MAYKRIMTKCLTNYKLRSKKKLNKQNNSLSRDDKNFLDRPFSTRIVRFEQLSSFRHNTLLIFYDSFSKTKAIPNTLAFLNFYSI